MKDTSHHLKQVQKKVLQATRKETRVLSRGPNHNNYLALVPANAKEKVRSTTF